jgi:uncharacterized protein
MLKLKSIVHAILARYPLPPNGIHGIAHWARVLETGIRLSMVTGANVKVVQLFAVFHDSQRVVEETDPSHGLRGARLAAELQGKLFDLSGDECDLLFVACAGHMDRPIDDDVTVQTCWDADRLDLGRVGAETDPFWLGEATVDEHTEIMEWADRRAKAHAIPELVQREWGISRARLSVKRSKISPMKRLTASTSRSVDAQPSRLGLSAAEYGRLVGVSGLKTYN